MKKLNPVNINIEADLDADDLGQRLVDCVNTMDANHNVVNLVKVHIGDIPAYDVSEILKKVIADPLTDMGITNFIVVPLKRGLIDDITIDYIEVRNNESDNCTN